MIRRNPDGTLNEFSVVRSMVGGSITGSRKNGKSNFIFHDGQTPPTEEEIDAEIKRLDEEYEKQAYTRLRQSEYPTINALIVALWEKVVEGRSESADALEVKRQEVKNANPKPL
tara:strand:- start:738 stop:1079 length:342 start_codon:yes stop_codon:yes gene_type:complete